MPDEQISPHPPADELNTNNRIALFVAAILVPAALILYARTEAFAWDEGYHLVAAWLIAHGKQPYIDFVFPQTPFNAYWNALLLRILGESWRVPHTIAALMTTGAVAMAASHVYRRLPAPPAWRAAAAFTTAVIFGYNTAVFEFGSLQAYGMCLFMVVAAYLATVSAVDRPGPLRPALAGVCAGVAAASSLLTAPVAPILLIWMNVVNRTGHWLRKSLAFIAGIVIAFVPLLRLLVKAPHPVIFGFLQYQLLYRKVEWDDAGIHNLGEVLGWADSSQAVLLVLLALAGIVFARKSSWSPALKSEIYLCGWLAVVQTVHLLAARPTFSRYFLLTVPFLAIAAAAGLFQTAERLTSGKPWVFAGILCAITSYGLIASLFEQPEDLFWSDVENTAAKVREVTADNATLLADECVYFLLHRAPPSGMELEDSHKLRLSDAEAMALHVLPRPKLDLMIRAGRFDTVEMCDDDEIERLDLATLYSKNATIGTCKVFWKWGTPSAPADK
jgi:4-amino-4-deoxy-L-arabinose transferase-like glycosyltransferase